MKTKVQKKILSHYRELRCDWCNKYHILPSWRDNEPSDKLLDQWKKKFLAHTGTQQVLYECRLSSCVRNRPEGWDDKWCHKCNKYSTCDHLRKM